MLLRGILSQLTEDCCHLGCTMIDLIQVFCFTLKYISDYNSTSSEFEEMMKHIQVEINIASLLSKTFSSTKTDISHYKTQNYYSIAEHCAPDAAAVSAANGHGINGISNAIKVLQLSLFGVSCSSAANRDEVALGLCDGSKTLALDTLRDENTNTIGNNGNSGGNIKVYNERDG